MMKYLLQLGCTLFLITSSLQAQDVNRHLEGPSKLDRLQQHLDLTEDQVSSIKTQMASLDSQELSKQEHRAAKKEILQGLLSTDQMAKFAARKKDRPHHHSKGHHRDHKHHMFHKSSKEVMEKLKNMRLALEETITTEDKEQIAELRKEAKAWSQQWTLKKQSFNETSEERIEEIEKELRSIKIAKASVGDKAEILADKYHPEIVELFKENEKFFMEMKAANRAKKAETHKYSNHCLSIPRESLEMGRPYALHKRIAFILMNVDSNNTNDTDDLDQREITTNNLATTPAPNLRLYPNPSTTETQILYEILTPSKVSINLLDEQGRFLKEVTNRYHEAGEYTIRLNTTALISKAYFVTLLDENNQQITEKLLIQK